MIEKTTQRFHAPRMKRAGRVIPLRSLPEASHRAAESNALSLPSLRQETVDATLHAIQNCLQTVSVGLDLVQLTDVIEQQDYDPIRGSIDRAGGDCSSSCANIAVPPEGNGGLRILPKS